MQIVTFKQETQQIRNFPIDKQIHWTYLNYRRGWYGIAKFWVRNCTPVRTKLEWRYVRNITVWDHCIFYILKLNCYFYSGNLFITYILSIIQLWSKKLITNKVICMLSSGLRSNWFNFQMEHQVQTILCY
jgi:hypothetical protein